MIQLRREGISLQYLDFGGGLGIAYDGEETPSPSCYAELVIGATKDLGLTLILEPGRVIVGNAGTLVTRVNFIKDQGTKRFVIVDAGMNDLIRPALYGSHHQVWSVAEKQLDSGCRYRGTDLRIDGLYREESGSSRHFSLAILLLS